MRRRTNSIDHELLQSYINRRAAEKGLRGKPISRVTIKKEMTTLRAAWAWAADMNLLDTALPSGKRLRFPKTR